MSTRLTWIVYAGLSAGYLAWGWCGELSDLGGDSATYMLAARQLSPFQTPVPAYAQALAGNVYPPLFPLAIGLLGGGFLAAHLLVIAALLGALACLYLWLRAEAADAAVSAWTCAVFALMPGTYLLALNLWTENPYLWFSLVAILAARRAVAEPGRAGAWCVCAGAVAAASLVRAAALPLLAAFVIHLALQRPRRWPWLLTTGLAPFCLWALWSEWHRSGLAGYASQWRQVYAADPIGALRQQFGREIPALLRAWIQSWLGPRSPGWLALPALAFGAVALGGCAWRLRYLRFDALYVALYLALIVVWPFPAEAQRLGYVIVPVLLGQTVLAARAVAARLPHRVLRHAGALVLAGASALVVPALVLSAKCLAQPLPPDLAGARHFAAWYLGDRTQALRLARSQAWIFADLRRIGGVVPPDDCIVSIKPAVVTLYTRRLSRLPPPPAASAAEFERGIGVCRFAYLLIYNSPSFPQAFYPDARLGGRGRILSVLKNPAESPPAVYAVLLDLRDPATLSR